MVKLEIWQTDPGQTQVWPGYDLDQFQTYEQRSAKLSLSSPSCAINGNWLPWGTAHWSTGMAVWRDAPQTAVPRHGRVSPRDPIRSFHATQVSACWFATQIHYIQRGYGIRCKRNKPILALNLQQNISYKKGISNVFSFNKKGWLKMLNMQWQNGLN